MKISSITVQNFKGIEKMKISPEHVTVFMGKNGSGKSSLLEAITFVLTGKIKPEYIRNGTGAASVTLEFSDGTNIERSRSAAGSVVRCNGKRTTGKSVNEFLEEKLGADTGTYEALCGIDYLQSLSSKDLSSLFLSILPIKVSFDKFCEFSDKIANEEFGRTLEQEDKEYLYKIIGADVFGIDEMTDAYKKAFDERRIKNGLVKNLITKAEFDQKTLPKESKDDLYDQLTKIGKVEADMANYQKQMKFYIDSVKKNEIAISKKKELENALAAYTDFQKPDESVKKQAEEDKAKFQDAIDKSRGFIATANSNIALFNKTLSSLNKPVCPISEKLICTSDKSSLKNELTELVEQNQKVVTEHQNFIKRCEEQITKRDNKIKNFNDMLVQYTKKEGLEKQIKDFVIPEILPKPDEIEAKDYSAVKAKLQRKISLHEAHAAATKAYQEFEKENKILRRLEIAVRCLDVKTGVPNIILKAALATFEAAANKKAAQIDPDFKLAISCDNGISITVKTKGSTDYLPLDVVSTGEYIIVAFLLMDIINQITDAKYLVIDNLDALDAEHAKMFLDLLDKDSSYEHVFVGTVDHEDTKKVMTDKHVVTL